MTTIRVELRDGAWFEWTKGWLWRSLPWADPARLFADVWASTPWAERSVQIGGRPVLQPRMVAWMADRAVVYRYSGSDNVATPWTPEVTAVRERLAAASLDFNACFLNLYRHERDSIGWHADDEPLFGPAPVIASVSLGSARRFQIRDKAVRNSTRELRLEDGDLLVMGGTFQQHYQHAVPKERTSCGERINLTFRNIR